MACTARESEPPAAALRSQLDASTAAAAADVHSVTTPALRRRYNQPSHMRCSSPHRQAPAAGPPACLMPSLRAQEEYTKEKKLHILDRLAWSEQFEKFLAAKYAAAKRFGLEGAETLIPGMKAMIDLSAELGVEAICMGMPHRGTDLGDIAGQKMVEVRYP